MIPSLAVTGECFSGNCREDGKYWNSHTASNSVYFDGSWWGGGKYWNFHTASNSVYFDGSWWGYGKYWNSHTAFSSLQSSVRVALTLSSYFNICARLRSSFNLSTLSGDSRQLYSKYRLRVLKWVKGRGGNILYLLSIPNNLKLIEGVFQILNYAFLQNCCYRSATAPWQFRHRANCVSYCIMYCFRGYGTPN